MAIGEALEENTRADASIAIVNQESSGGLDNARSVMTMPNSFGLVQEDTLAKEDFIRDHIRYVTPLYLERLHIIYDHGAYEDVYQKMVGSSSDTPRPSLGTSANMHEAVKAFFQQAEVSTGPVGTASRIFASYLLDVCEIGPIMDHGLPFAEALDSLMHEDDGIDIVFSIAGAPLASVREALQTDGGKDLRLMSVESALVPELNERYGVKLRGSTFKAKYDGYHNTSTIGSYAFLVTSKDVPNLAVMELLRVLDNSTEEMKRDLAVGTDKQFQLEEFPFYDSFRQQNQNFLMQLMGNLVIFVVSVSITTTGALVFLTGVLFGLRNVGDFRRAREAAAREQAEREEREAQRKLAQVEIERARENMRQVLQLPESPFRREGIELAHRLKQSTTISGDFYQLIPRQDGSLGIYLVDVEGHGLAASQTAQDLHRLLTDSSLNWGLGEPREQLRIADRRVSEEFGDRKISATMCFAEIDPVNKVIRFANAGMPYPLLFRRGESQPEVLRAAGFFVGDGYSRFPAQPDRAEVSVSEGDLLVLFSDGIPEAANSQGRTFAQLGVINAVETALSFDPEKVADTVLHEVRRHSGEDAPADDQSLLVVRIGEPPSEPPQVRVEIIKITETSDQLEASIWNAEGIGNELDRKLRPRILSWVGKDRPAFANSIWAAIWEAAANAVKHGSERGDLVTLRVRCCAPQRWPGGSAPGPTEAMARRRCDPWGAPAPGGASAGRAFRGRARCGLVDETRDGRGNRHHAQGSLGGAAHQERPHLDDVV